MKYEQENYEQKKQTGGRSMKLCQGKFRQDIRKRLFPQKVPGHWHRLPGEVTTASA